MARTPSHHPKHGSQCQLRTSPRMIVIRLAPSTQAPGTFLGPFADSWPMDAYCTRIATCRPSLMLVRLTIRQSQSPLSLYPRSTGEGNAECSGLHAKIETSVSTGSRHRQAHTETERSTCLSQMEVDVHQMRGPEAINILLELTRIMPSPACLRAYGREVVSRI